MLDERSREVAKYNVIDTIAPVLVSRELEKGLREDYTYSDYLVEWYSRITSYASSLAASGFHIDVDKLREVELNLRTEQEELREKAKAIVDLPELNLDSPKQVQDVIYNKLGCKLPDIKGAYTPGGQPSTSQEILPRVKDKSGFVDALLQFRKISKDLRTYVQGVYSNLTHNGFVFPDYYIVKSPDGGTVSGRWSVKNPALQTFPYTEIRKCFISRYLSSGCLVDIDADQMELRVGAHLANDPTLLGIFRSGSDPHQATADLCGVDRPTGKAINFGAVYDISINGLVQKMGLDYATATDVYHTLKTRWEKLYDYQTRTAIEACNYGKVSTPYGRWRRVPGATPSTPEGSFLIREAQNFKLQAMASDIVQLLGSVLVLALEGIALPVMTNHDGLTFDCQKSDLDKVLSVFDSCIREFPDVLKEVLNINMSLPLDFSVKVGDNWLDQQPIDRRFSTYG
jgi:DNA polymerase-1